MTEQTNYDGPGLYRHYKGGTYEVLGLALQEDTVDKGDGESGLREVTFVIYRPLTSGSMLEDRDETFWARELSDFNESVLYSYTRPGGIPSAPREFPRFCQIKCSQCQERTLKYVGGTLAACSTCGSNQPVI